MEKKNLFKDKRSIYGITAIVVIVIIVFGAILTRSTPERTTKEFFTAIENGQYKRAIEYTDINEQIIKSTTDKSIKEKVINELVEGFSKEYSNLKIKVNSIKVVSDSKDKATCQVNYDVTIEGENGKNSIQDIKETVDLRNINGRYVITYTDNIYNDITEIYTQVATYINK